MPLITTAQYNSSWTSWTLLGGKQVNTSYVGGSYKFADVWTYNSTKNEIVNTQFFKPVMWVFMIKPSNVTVTTTAPTTAPTTRPTTIPTTAPYTSTSNNGGYYAAAIVVIVIIIIVVVAATMRRKK